MSGSRSRRLGDLVKLTSGQSPSGFHFGTTGHPFFKVDQLGKSTKYLTRAETPYVSNDVPVVPPGSVLIAKRGGAIALNRVRILNEPGFMDTNVMALTPTDGLETEYLFYWLSYRGLWDIADVTSVPQINNKHINPLEIQLPSKREQRAIAEALCDADAHIASIERLIAKKRDVKQGLMRELLTGRTRLPGFTGVWRRQQSLLSAVTKSSGYWGAAPGTADIDGRVIRAGDVTATHSLKGYALRGLTASEAARADLHVGDVVLTASGTIGNVAHIDEPGFFSSNFVRALRPRFDAITGEYLYYALQSRAARTAMDAHLGVSAMPNLGSGFYTDPWLDLPPVDEQRAIGAVMRDADAEIAALGRRLVSARNIKQGMMQELLTGRTRLVSEVAA